MGYTKLTRTSTSNHMFGRAICYKLLECIFENFEIAGILKFSKITWILYPNNCPNQLPRPNMRLLVNHIKPTNILYLKLISFNSEQLQISERAITK